MKKIRIIITLAFVLSIFTFGKAQNTISEIVNDSTLNYHQKVKKIHENGNALLNSASEKELKFYYRWNWFWSNRTDNKGSMKLAHKSI